MRFIFNLFTEMKVFYFLLVCVLTKRLFKKDIIAYNNKDNNGPIEVNDNKETIAVFVSDAIKDLDKGNTSITANGFNIVKGDDDTIKEKVNISELNLDENYYDTLINKKIKNLEYKKYLLKMREQKEKEIYEKMLNEDYYIK